MIPILYEKTETAFTSNGLGRLSDCIRCIATEERNGIYEVEFDYPVTGVLFSEIQEGRIIACTHDEQGDVQPFDIYRRTEPINGVVTFYAHHISYRQNEIVVKPFEAGSATEAIAKIKSQSVNTNPFTYWTNKSVTASFTSEAPKNARDLLMGEEGSMLDAFGTGEYEFDKFNVKLYLHRGQDTNVSIRYGKNLADFQNEYDVSEAYTAVVPYWLGEVTEEGAEESTQVLVMLPELFISSGHSVPSGREVIVPMDLSDEFEDAPTIAQLRSRAQSRLTASDAWLPNQTVTVDFVQLWQTEEYAEYAPLQRLRLCDTCGVFVPMYNTALRLKIIRVTYNVLLDRYDQMELGDKPATYTAMLEKMYDSKVAGVEAGLKTIAIDIQTAQQTAINVASADATAKADNAKAQAISTASADATSKADAAKADAISTASADATSKANAAEQNAKNYADSGLSSLKSDLETQIDGKIETWAQTANPANAWTTAELKAQHDGDLWLYTGMARMTIDAVQILPYGVYQYNASTAKWSAYSSTSNNIYSLAQTKAQIFYGSPSDTFSGVRTGDYLVDSNTGKTYRYDGSAWVLQTDYKTYASGVVSAMEQVIKSEYEQAIDDATEKIRGGTGGYVVTTVNANGQPIELLITDNLDLSQAVNVWRWNEGGLAHSSNGYNGPFADVAITADGKINASMILTGALTANLITAGTITDSSGDNYWNLDTGQFVTESGKIADFTIENGALTYTQQTARGGHTVRIDNEGFEQVHTGYSTLTNPVTYYYNGPYMGDGKIGVVSGLGSSAEEAESNATQKYYINVNVSGNSSGVTDDLWLRSDLAYPYNRYLRLLNASSAIPIHIDLNTYVTRDFSVGGTKSRVVDTDNYSKRLQYCYETPTPLFGDIGEAQLDEDGICYVDIDDIFSETIEARQEYQVFLQKEGEGDCWIAEKQKRYFVIKGTPNLKVAWELKAKQRDYDMIRLEQPESGLDEYGATTDDDTSLDAFINEQEELLYGNN